MSDLDLNQLAFRQENWHTQANQNFDRLVEGVARVAALDVAAITSPNIAQVRAAGLVFTGAPSEGVTVTLPRSGVWTVLNLTDQTVTLRRTPGGLTFTLPAGARDQLLCDADNAYRIGADLRLNASNLIQGTVPGDRLSGAYTGITSVGTLTGGSITATFGDINIGSNTFTGNGSGLTSLPAGQLTGFVDPARLNSVPAASLTGTVVSARISGSYTGITGTGALAAGSISATFGDINIGSSVFTGSGAGLTNLPATSLTGTINVARLPGVALRHTTSGLVSGNVVVSDDPASGAADNGTIWIQV